MRKITIVIPARYASKRFPGKPMVDIAGQSLLERTWKIARAVSGVEQVLIATEDQRIVDAAEGFGAKAVLTSAECPSGTVRAYEAVTKHAPESEVIVNLQGDALMTPPWVVQAVVNQMNQQHVPEIATPAVHLTGEQYDQFVESKKKAPSSGTLVVFDKSKRALYFSKALIPFMRERPEVLPVYRHIGLYAFTMESLKKYCSFEESSLEAVEKLEQLRALENGMHIQVVPVDYRGRTHWSVDSPEDVAIAEQIIQKEGELV